MLTHRIVAVEWVWCREHHRHGYGRSCDIGADVGCRKDREIRGVSREDVVKRIIGCLVAARVNCQYVWASQKGGR